MTTLTNHGCDTDLITCKPLPRTTWPQMKKVTTGGSTCFTRLQATAPAAAPAAMRQPATLHAATSSIQHRRPLPEYAQPKPLWLQPQRRRPPRQAPHPHAADTANDPASPITPAMRLPGQPSSNEAAPTWHLQRQLASWHVTAVVGPLPPCSASSSTSRRITWPALLTVRQQQHQPPTLRQCKRGLTQLTWWSSTSMVPHRAQVRRTRKRRLHTVMACLWRSCASSQTVVALSLPLLF